MFYGTRLFYKLSYFITAMSPTYVLFLLQLNSKFENEVYINIFKFELNAYEILFIIILIMLLIAIFLKFIIQRQLKFGRGNTMTITEMRDFEKEYIEEYNGNILSFLLGTVIPAVLIIETSIKEAIMVFLVIQIIMFILISRSSEIFPNLMLIILGIDLCKMINGKYLLLLNQEDDQKRKVIQLGNPSKSKLFVTSIKK